MKKIVQLRFLFYLMLGCLIINSCKRKNSPQELYNQHFKAPETLSFTILAEPDRSDGDKVNKHKSSFQSILTTYHEKDFMVAIEQLEMLDSIVQDEYHAEISYALGILHLLDEDEEQAIAYLDDGQDFNQEGYRWYKSLALLKLDRADEVPILLKPLADQPNPMQEVARIVLGKLNQ